MVLQRAVRDAVLAAGLSQRASCQTLRHSFATHLPEGVYGFLIAIGCYAAAIVVGILLKAAFPEKDHPVYSTYKDLVPFVIAIPAAWLGLCVQQRNSYMQQLRKLWSDMVGCVQEGIQYTFLAKPTEDQYAKALSRFSLCPMGQVLKEPKSRAKNPGGFQRAPGCSRSTPSDSVKPTKVRRDSGGRRGRRARSRAA
jgi:hypothetical protein